MRRTKRFDAVQLQTYTDEEIAIIASVEDDYPQDVTLAELAADYCGE